MMRTLRLRVGLLALLCSALAGCDNAHVYGSIGFSSFSGGGYGPGMGSSISIGGRIL